MLQRATDLESLHAGLGCGEDEPAVRIAQPPMGSTTQLAETDGTTRRYLDELERALAEDTDG